MIDKRGFRWGSVFTSLCLIIIVSLDVCGGAGFVGGLSFRIIAASTISNYADDVLDDGFVGAGEFYLLSGRYVRVINGCLVHEVLADGDGSVFDIVGLGNYP